MEENNKIEVKSWLKKQEAEFLDNFKKELIIRLEPVIQNLVEYLRAMEKANSGSGKAEIKDMLNKGDINEPMFHILMPALDNLEKDYIINLQDSEYFKPTTLS